MSRAGPPRFIAFLGSPRNLRRAITTSLIVGPVLTLINQTHVAGAIVTGGPVPPIAIIRVALTFAVPFVVSLVSASMADAARR